MKKILITGGMGYIGTTLPDFLKSYQVTIIDNFLFNQENLIPGLLAKYDNVNIVREDLVVSQEKLSKELEDTDVVIHLAALVGMPICNKAGEAITHMVNIGITKNILALAKPETKIIFPNTNSAYGTSPEGSICDENSPTNPISSYGKTKCDAEELVLQSRPNSCVFRLATVFGLSPRMRLDLMVNDFTYRAKFNNILSLYEGHFRRNFVHVKDVCRAFHHAIINDLRGVYNLGNDSANTTKLGLAQHISKYTGCVVEEEEGKDPDQRNYNVSSKKLYDTGFKCMYGLDYGIEELLTFYSCMTQWQQHRDSIIKGMKNV